MNMYVYNYAYFETQFILTNLTQFNPIWPNLTQFDPI